MANPISIKDPDSRLEKTTFPKEIFISFYTIYIIYTNHNHIPTPKRNIWTISKWRLNNRFSFRVILILAKI